MNEALIRFEDISRLFKNHPDGVDYTLGDGFLIGSQAAAGEGSVLSAFSVPVRFDGIILSFLLRGKVKVDVNVNSYIVEGGSMVMLAPGTLNRISLPEGVKQSDIDIFFLIMSHDFLENLNQFAGRSIHERLKLYSTPCFTLSDTDRSIARDYFHLIRKVANSGQKNAKEMVMGLASSLSFYTSKSQAVQSNSSLTVPADIGRRKKKVFNTFLSLVSEYHIQERELNFYAAKMSISRKYLGKVVKEASGRKASDWINDLVIMEAKSMLKYSDKPIKEIVYRLNFGSQSIFYKYFKAHTGMTPSKYRSLK